MICVITPDRANDFSNFGSLKSTETTDGMRVSLELDFQFQQFRLVEEH